MKKIIIMLVFLIICFTALSAEKRQIRFVSLEYPPYVFDKGGKVHGIAYEIVRSICNELDYEFCVEIHDWDKSLELFHEGKADAIFTIYRTEDREKFAAFMNSPIINQKSTFIAHADSNNVYEPGMDSLSDLKLGIIRGFSYGSIFDSALKEGKFKNIIYSQDLHDNIQNLLEGKCDIIVSDLQAALYWLNKMGKKDEVRVLKPYIQIIPSYVAFRRTAEHEEILKKFNETFDKIN